MKTGNVELGSISKSTVEQTGFVKGSDLKNSGSGALFSSVMNKAGQSLNSNQNYNGASAKSLLANDFSSLKMASSSSSLDSTNSFDRKKQQSSLQDVGNAVSKQDSIEGGSVLDTYASELTDKLKEELGLTDQELEELLAQMGIGVSQLFDPQMLQQFVLESFGAEDISEALLNEQLSNALVNCSDILEDVVSSLQTEILKLPSLEEGTGSFDEVLNEQETTNEGEGVAKENTSSGETDVHVEIHKEAKEETGDSSKGNRGDGEFHSTNFVDYFADKVNLNSFDTGNGVIPEFKQIVTSLVDQIKLTINPANTSVELVLNPEALGKVQVVVAEKDGVLTARMNVENQIAKEALESSLQQLKQSFEEQGLKVQKVEVAIGNYSSEYAEHEGKQNEQSNEGAKKKLRLEEYMEDTFTEAEEEQSSVVGSLTGTIEYTA
ncbi:MAG: flagellar hook-length control protein FliK [bacterium]|nr:flagellar hook-length control protein FliK [bacterium]